MISVSTPPKTTTVPQPDTTVLPTSLLIDRGGKIIWRQIGAIMPNDVKLKTVLEKAVTQAR